MLIDEVDELYVLLNCSVIRTVAGGQPLASPCRRGFSARKCAENTFLAHKDFVNQSIAHAELIASFGRAKADAIHKFELIKAVEKKGPVAIRAAVETAAKAAKRRDSLAKKLSLLGVSLKG